MAKSNKELEVIARELFVKGMKYKEIADQVKVSESCVKSWAQRKWKKEKVAKSSKVATIKKDATIEKDAKPKYGKGKNPNSRNQVPAPKNQRALKHGLFAKWLPQDTIDIMNEIGEEMKLNPFDLLWKNILFQYASIVRAQKIMYVEGKDDDTTSNVGNGMVATQYAWEKQANFMNAQSRAMSELNRMIKQYDYMINNNIALATEEQKERIALMRAKTKSLLDTGDATSIEDDGFINALNGTATTDWEQEDGND